MKTRVSRLVIGWPVFWRHQGWLEPTRAHELCGELMGAIRTEMEGLLSTSDVAAQGHDARPCLRASPDGTPKVCQQKGSVLNRKFPDTFSCLTGMFWKTNGLSFDAPYAWHA
jgi:hypothetical protein